MLRHKFSSLCLFCVNFLSLWCIQEAADIDIWNEIPCAEEYKPKNCDFDKLYPVTVDDFDRCAPAKLPLNARNYFLAASGRRITYTENKEAFRRIKIRPKILIDVTKTTTRTEAGRRYVDAPIGLSSVGAQKLAHPDGELATVRGASSMRSIMILSAFSTTSIEDVAKEAKGTDLALWMEIYQFKNLSLTYEIVRRARKSGFEALVLSADTNVEATLTCRDRTNLELPPGVSFPNLNGNKGKIIAPDTVYNAIRWLRHNSELPVVVKGILSAEDAKRAVNAGAHTLMVSNSGGRQIDGAPATIDVLPEVVATTKRDVYLDGGVRSGSDVYKALARGAKMVFVGRPIVWGLALNGSDGVNRMMNILKNELKETMQLAGDIRPEEIKRSSIMPEVPCFSCQTSKS